MKNRLGFGYSGIIMYFEQDKCYFLYSWEDMQKIKRELIKKVKKDPDYLIFLDDEDKKACRESLEMFKQIKALEKKSIQELKGLLALADKAYANVLSVSHIVEGWVHPTENLIRSKVKDMDNLVALTTPSFNSFLTKEQISLSKIANYAKEKGMKKIPEKLTDMRLMSMLEKHQKKYFWINNSYASAKVLAVSDFVKEANELIKKPKTFQDPKTIRRKKEAILKKINDKELTELIKINDTIFRIHDRRKEHMTISMHYIDLVLKGINKRTKIPMEHLRYLLPNEVNIDARKLEKRRKKCIYFVHYEGDSIYEGKTADEYIKQLENQHKVEDTVLIKGNSASNGVARGIVKVCRGEKEISKVEKGDILVACMTQPEFVPAMKKAAAIVTDEGGLTCHAAIVSRELGIPCVIGTKTATKILKDGQVVEVDATNGAVKIFS
ncbi:hypothetical protein GF323_02430 [Candidatus Woesearchaeota archaeon]|nr:hypothetical protein [Candidatus Woesearchaeota archaeon]